MAKRKKKKLARSVFNGAESAVRFLIFVLILVILILLGKTAYYYGYEVFCERTVEDEPGTDIEVTIPEGTSLHDICVILREAGVIRDAEVFYLQELLSDYHGKLKSGTYTVNTSMKPTEIMAVLAQQD